MQCLRKMHSCTLSSMHIVSTAIHGLYTIDIKAQSDERGLFARTWDTTIAKEQGLMERFDYTCISTNTKKGTLRGMHYQTLPHGEVKLVRCTKGKMFDVVIDLRPDSATFKQWFGAELTAENHTALYIPAGCAHGFMTLDDDTEVLYHITGAFVPEAATGVRWNDPAFAIAWPADPVVISERDAAYSDFVI